MSFNPSRILYTRDEVIFMIAEYLKNGELEYVNERVERKGQIKHSAPFENSILVKVELDERIKYTKEDGKKLISEIDNNYTINYRDLTQCAKNALNYISSGPNRRDVCYYMWLFTRKYTMKGEKCQCGNRTWRKIGGVAKACFKCGRVKNL